MRISGVEVRQTRGKRKLAGQLNLLHVTPGFGLVRSLGVVQDADNDHRATFAGVCGALRRAGLPVPSSGLQPAGEHPKVVVLIIPGEGKPGALEDVCLESIKDDPAMRCVDQYFECLKGRGIREPAQISKAKAHAFLASRRIPDLRLGDACQQHYWPFEHEAFADLRKLLWLLSK